ncbi:MAG TPA: TolC family protein, partial [Gemmatimonadaceae bacterium]
MRPHRHHPSPQNPPRPPRAIPRVGAMALLAIIAIATAAAAQGPSESVLPATLSLPEAVDRAIRQYPALDAATAAADEARALVAQASAARLPSLALTGSLNRYEQPMLVTPIHGFTAGQLPPFDRTLYQGAATLSWTLTDGGAREARIRRGRAGASAATADEAAALQRLVARVATTYVRVLALAQVAAAHEARIAALTTERGNARQRLDAGRAARVELLRAEAALDAASADQVHARESLDLAERELAQLTGSPVDEVRAPRLAATTLAPTPLPSRAELLARAR